MVRLLEINNPREEGIRKQEIKQASNNHPGKMQSRC